VQRRQRRNPPVPRRVDRTNILYTDHRQSSCGRLEKPPVSRLAEPSAR
jgi:hypothetical protein